MNDLKIVLDKDTDKKILETLLRGDKVKISKFGVFELSKFMKKNNVVENGKMVEHIRIGFRTYPVFKKNLRKK